jgi:hypothetical protein
MKAMKLSVRGVAAVSLLLTTAAWAQTGNNSGATPVGGGASDIGSQGAFVNGKAAARNAHAPRLWIAASLTEYNAFKANAFDGPNITTPENPLDLVHQVKQKAITDIMTNANLALAAASQQFLADLAASKNQGGTAANPIGQGPLDDFFGDVSGGTGGTTSTPGTSGSGQTSNLNDTQIDDLFGNISGQASAGSAPAVDVTQSNVLPVESAALDAATLEAGSAGDVSSTVSAQVISPFDGQLDRNVVEMTNPEATPAE